MHPTRRTRYIVRPTPRTSRRSSWCASWRPVRKQPVRRERFDANMNQGTVKFDFCTGRGRVLQGHQARGDARHAQRVEEPALRLDRRQRQRSEHLRDIPRRASVPRVGARRPRIASTASRRGREHRVASSVDRIDEGRGRGADPRTPSTRHNDPRRYMIKFTQKKSSVPNEHPAANKPAHRLYRRNLVLDVD